MIDQPPLPPGPPPNRPPDVVVADDQDDGWDALFDEDKQQWYFYNRFTKQTTTRNPRVPEAEGAIVKHDDAVEEEDEITKELKQDPEFAKLSTYEKYKRYVDLKASKETDTKESDEDSEADPSVVDKEAHSDTMKALHDLESGVVLDKDDPSAMMNKEAKGKSYKQQRGSSKVTKKDIKRFEKKREERKKKNFQEWYKGDEEEDYGRRKRYATK